MSLNYFRSMLDTPQTPCNSQAVFYALIVVMIGSLACTRHLFEISNYSVVPEPPSPAWRPDKRTYQFMVTVAILLLGFSYMVYAKYMPDNYLGCINSSFLIIVSVACFVFYVMWTVKYHRKGNIETKEEGKRKCLWISYVTLFLAVLTTLLLYNGGSMAGVLSLPFVLIVALNTSIHIYNVLHEKKEKLEEK
jgi:Ca2+/Na+ antiporter